MLKLKLINYKNMKVSRIYPYNKTKGERRHESEVAAAKRAGFKHPGSKIDKTLYYIVKDNLQKKHKVVY